jgi:DNA (cytosine-5)-methyltransferase 1
MTARKFKAISLFSGAMGLDLGLESTGRFEILACLEKEPAFCETIRLNQKAGRLSNKLRIYEGSILDIPPEKVMEECGLQPGELDLLVGGPPCQSFSTAGKRGTVQDPRGLLIWQFLKFVEVLQPKFFIMENVRGLVSAALKHRPIAERPERGGTPLTEKEERGSVIRLLARDLQNCGSATYRMDCFEVNAVNYGAPQLRERAIFIGNRFNKIVDFPDPTHGHSEPGMSQWSTLRDAIGDLDDPGDVIMDFSPRKKRYLSMVPEGSNWRSLPLDVQKESMGRAWLAKGGRSGWWRRLSFDLPCPTLITMPNHASTSLCHPTEVRALTLKEYALIQEFPPDWAFAGTPMQQYAQAGNAVPIRLGRVAGEVVAGALDDMKRRRWQPEDGHPEEYRIVYVQSHVRTRQWYKNGETKVWADGEANKTVRYASPVTRRSERAMAECE